MEGFDTTEFWNLLQGTGTIYDMAEIIGKEIGKALVEAQAPARAAHPYIGRRGRVTRTFIRKDPEVFEGTIVHVGTDHEEYEDGPGLFPSVTLRLDDGSHRTRHIDCLTLLPEIAEDAVTPGTDSILADSIRDALSGAVDGAPGIPAEDLADHVLRVEDGDLLTPADRKAAELSDA